MNETNKQFLDSLGIDPERVQGSSLFTLRKQYEINRILSNFQFYRPKVRKRVSIADIVGYEYTDSNNIAENLDKFFDRDGDGYHSRSVSMLDIPTSRIIDDLGSSFVKEPISLKAADEGNVYLIADNGLHRFHVMKMHYLSELMKIDPRDEARKRLLRDKYTFDAYVIEPDLVKTYSAFLLSHLNVDLNVEGYYDENYEMTDQVCVTDDNRPGERLILDDDNLLRLVRSQLAKFYRKGDEFDIKYFEQKFKEALDSYPSFRKFCQENLRPSKEEEESWNFD